MKTKFLSLFLIITSLFGYLEWGKDNSSFLFQAECEVFRQILADPNHLVHPFVFLPIFGQFLILITLFQKNPKPFLIYLGIACLGLLLGFMFFIGLLGMNFKILISTVPFIGTAIVSVRHMRKTKSNYA